MVIPKKKLDLEEKQNPDTKNAFSRIYNSRMGSRKSSLTSLNNEENKFMIQRKYN